MAGRQTVDKEDVLLGKRMTSLQNLEPGTENDVILQDQYDELYEAPDMASFEEIGLKTEIIQGLYVEMGFEKPSKIQGMTLPAICNEPFPSLVAQVLGMCGITVTIALSY